MSSNSNSTVRETSPTAFGETSPTVFDETDRLREVLVCSRLFSGLDPRFETWLLWQCVLLEGGPANFGVARFMAAALLRAKRDFDARRAARIRGAAIRILRGRCAGALIDLRPLLKGA